MKRSLLYLFLLLSFFGKAQQVKDTLQIKLFAKYVNTILQDSSKDFMEYPKPPVLTNNVLMGLQQELKDDSSKYYFERLSKNKFQSAQDYTTALSFYKKYRQTYCLLALTAHWNPDVRITALTSLNWLIKLRPMICTKKQYFDKLISDDKVCLAFLIHLLESNPLFISGSENATIHGVYISNILWNLDLLTHKNIVGKSSFSEWYKNDLQFETAVLEWKSYLHKK